MRAEHLRRPRNKRVKGKESPFLVFSTTACLVTVLRKKPPVDPLIASVVRAAHLETHPPRSPSSPPHLFGTRVHNGGKRLQDDFLPT
ncbi:hypothetical protein Q7C36_004163 [Tachysurus vachellii]|uniref:Uncharacterized protein n=1 Tax=Tachysurus vachellii TaxID=175792 RepID=A0AA88T3R7_TACVA|nr:hypothetical protein Q7C36_004163 [Tachysurus vachellii]